MKKLLLLLVSFIFCLSSFSQDIIIHKDGRIINCKITNIDSVKVYYIFNKNNRDISTFLDRSMVSEIQYNVQGNPGVSNSLSVAAPNLRNAITIGVLNGGGSLLGFDIEALLGKKFGIQAGIGLSSFGAALNFHFRPTVRSPFLSFQYMHQGFNDSYYESNIGPSFVFRGKKWLTFSIGMGYILEKGPQWTEINGDDSEVSAILTYSIGGYIPW